MDKLYVFIECTCNIPITESINLLLLGKKLASESGKKLIAVVFKSDVKREKLEGLLGYCNTIIIIGNEVQPCETDKYVNILVELCKRENPNIFLFASTDLGKVLSSQISAEMSAGLTAECCELSIEGNSLIQRRPANSGGVFADIRTKKGFIQMATVKNFDNTILKSQQELKYDTTIIDKVYDCAYNSKIMQLSLCKKSSNIRNKLGDAGIVIGVGAGVDNEATYLKIQKYANLIGASIGFTRAVSGYPWYDQRYLIGQSGVDIKASLYIALGISGSAQHILGVKKCKKIFAVNRNGEAAIFEYANIGLIDDVEKIIDYLLDHFNTTQPHFDSII